MSAIEYDVLAFQAQNGGACATLPDELTVSWNGDEIFADRGAPSRDVDRPCYFPAIVADLDRPDLGELRISDGAHEVAAAFSAPGDGRTLTIQPAQAASFRGDDVVTMAGAPALEWDQRWWVRPYLRAPGGATYAVAGGATQDGIVQLRVPAPPPFVGAALGVVTTDQTPAQITACEGARGGCELQVLVEHAVAITLAP